MAALELHPDEALAELSRRSQGTSTELRDLPAQVVEQAQEAHGGGAARRS